MSGFVLGFIFGIVFGGIVGFFAAALSHASGDSEEASYKDLYELECQNNKRLSDLYWRELGKHE